MTPNQTFWLSLTVLGIIGLINPRYAFIVLIAGGMVNLLAKVPA
jgi:hypothetical protein